jgi:hypothetical protein
MTFTAKTYDCKFLSEKQNGFGRKLLSGENMRAKNWLRILLSCLYNLNVGKKTDSFDKNSMTKTLPNIAKFPLPPQLWCYDIFLTIHILNKKTPIFSPNFSAKIFSKTITLVPGRSPTRCGTSARRSWLSAAWRSRRASSSAPRPTARPEFRKRNPGLREPPIRWQSLFWGGGSATLGPCALINFYSLLFYLYIAFIYLNL